MNANVRRDIKVDGVFDLETANWTEYVLGGLRLADGTYQQFPWRQEEALVDALFSIQGDVWSHNGGRFDIKWILDWANVRGMEARVALAGSRIVAARVGHTRFLDSKALTRLTLAEFTEGLSVSKETLGLPCVGAARGCDAEPGHCEGYCAISRRMPAAQFRRLSDYLKADCESLWQALERLREFASEHNLDLGNTVGASAWRCAQRWLELPGANLSPREHNFARLGYYGGRVQLFRPREPRGWECDVNSMYPSRLMQCPVPTGRPVWRYASSGLAYGSGMPGIYEATVDVPESHVPPLPHRLKDRVAYPTGTFRGVWCAPELKHAEDRGAKVLKVHRGLVWRHASVMFESWVRSLFDLRRRAGKKTAIGIFLKYYLNSLTGKTGSRPDSMEAVLNPEEITPCKCAGAGRCKGCICCRGCRGKCGALQPLDADGTIFARHGWRLTPCCHVEWAGYLCAEARVEWDTQANSVSDGWDVVYGDTDSCFSLWPRVRNIGTDAGTWEDGGDWRNFNGYAPKMYTYEKAGVLRVRGKGLRLPEDASAAAAILEARTPVGKSGPLGFLAAARTGKMFAVDTLTRRPGRGYGDRILEPGASVTRAPRAGELAA